MYDQLVRSFLTRELVASTRESCPDSEESFRDKVLSSCHTSAFRTSSLASLRRPIRPEEGYYNAKAFHLVVWLASRPLALVGALATNILHLFIVKLETIISA